MGIGDLSQASSTKWFMAKTYIPNYGIDKHLEDTEGLAWFSCILLHESMRTKTGVK